MQNKVKMIGTCVAGLLMTALAAINTPPPNPGDMQLSTKGYEILLDLESCRLEPYKCSAKKWTNGAGNTFDVNPERKITEQEAAADLKRNVARFERAVNDSVKTEMSQPVFDSMVLFSFNVGIAGFKSSTALKMLNENKTIEACRWLLPWNKITVIKNGKPVKVTSPGLDNRRSVEHDLCVSGVRV